MHANNVKCQDIKPSNISHKGDQVYLTAFGSSATSQSGFATSTDSPAYSTAVHAAPEITARLYKEPRLDGRSVDVYGLGRVYCDLLTARTGRSVQTFHEMLNHDQRAIASALGASIHTSQCASNRCSIHVEGLGLEPWRSCTPSWSPAPAA
ncbi:hypothetical protein T440DRAFT_465312 [Plenodomus tracheiphilus IPT5]|uniref:Protein kinase domain-containing protein n=1 Tax=Plenodomus tracheiphilus IPT5 TaxID=1408161 RepID=A0A6A7BGF7_9PLEO|nr:hypothetical protein T440DRAFT_465312 [Plenodomus tracheiphilus IPT5]